METVLESRSQQGYALARDEGEAFWLLGMLQTVKIGKEDTDGRYGMLEIVVPGGSVPRGMCTPRRTSGSTSSTAPSLSGWATRSSS